MVALPPTTVARARRVSEYFQDLWNRREFALYLGLGNLKARNASTALGLIWWVLNPLLLGGVYFLVFGLLFAGQRPDNFLAYLLSGMFVFHFTAQSLTGGANSILQNAKLLANLRFPRVILPISAILESAVGFLASLAVFYAITLPFSQSSVNYRILYLPGILILHLLFNLGLACLAARLAVPFRDVNNLMPYISRIWLYVSPIIWPLSFLDDAGSTAETLVRLNPMFGIISIYRSLLFGTPIGLSELLWTVAWAIAAAAIGLAVFIKYEGHIVRHL
jgi:teichoic acid transport system permease protein